MYLIVCCMPAGCQGGLIPRIVCIILRPLMEHKRVLCNIDNWQRKPDRQCRAIDQAVARQRRVCLLRGFYALCKDQRRGGMQHFCETARTGIVRGIGFYYIIPLEAPFCVMKIYLFAWHWGPESERAAGFAAVTAKHNRRRQRRWIGDLRLRRVRKNVKEFTQWCATNYKCTRKGIEIYYLCFRITLKPKKKQWSLLEI